MIRLIYVAAAGCSIYLVAVLMPYVSRTMFELDSSKGNFPEALEPMRVVRKSENFGCTIVVYETSPSASDRVKAGGLAYLADQRPYKNRARNPYGDWFSTPGSRTPDGRNWQTASGRFIYALGAAGGCHNEGTFHRGDQSGFDPRKALDSPGSFYAVTANGEGLVLFDTIRRRAAFLYFG